VTLPLIAALKRAGPEERYPVEAILRAGATGEGEVGTMITFIERHGGMRDARAMAERYGQWAIEALAPFPACPEREALTAMARFAVERSF